MRHKQNYLSSKVRHRGARVFAILVCFLFTSCTFFEKNPYEDANKTEIDSFLKIHLPFSSQTKFIISQGAFGKQSHSEKGNEYSWDFDVPYGTAVLAVEAGEVIEVWQPDKGGGCDPTLSDYAHNIKIRHTDGKVAQYVHVNSLVKVGDQIKVGQQIAVTAENGWICTPQLHFGVYNSDKNLYNSPDRQTVPVYFVEIPNGLAKQGLRF